VPPVIPAGKHQCPGTRRQNNDGIACSMLCPAQNSVPRIFMKYVILASCEKIWKKTRIFIKVWK
jgi:hypothetical protein